MFLKQLDLTTALRPSYPPDEVLLFVQDNVGLYEGYVCVSLIPFLGLTAQIQEIQTAQQLQQMLDMMDSQYKGQAPPLQQPLK